jgi:hypothetical protein
VTIVSKTTEEDVVLEMIGNLTSHANRAECYIRARESFRHRDQIRHNFPVVDREPFASAPETGHHFVGDQKNAVLVAKITQALQISVRRDENAVRACNWFDDQRSDRLSSFKLDHLFSTCKHFFRCVPTSLNTVVILRDTKDTRYAWLCCPATRIAC